MIKINLLALSMIRVENAEVFLQSSNISRVDIAHYVWREKNQWSLIRAKLEALYSKTPEISKNSEWIASIEMAEHNLGFCEVISKNFKLDQVPYPQRTRPVSKTSIKRLLEQS